MARRVRRLAVVVVLILAGGAVALVLTARPQLDDRRDDVDRAWTQLRAPLTARYERLAAVRAEAATANELEGLAARLQAVVLSSDRLRAVDPLNQALATFHGAAPPPPAVKAYNDAVREYEDARTSFARRPVADVFGYDARPQLSS